MNEPRIEDYEDIDAWSKDYSWWSFSHRTTANVRFRWLKAIFTLISKLTSRTFADVVHNRKIKGG